jgi:four helix bundle protein
MDLCDEIYAITEHFPQHELYGLTAQLRRAAVRVPSCIAEGEGRQTDGERLQFLGYARGSLYEIGTQLRIATRRQYPIGETTVQLLEKAKKTLEGYIAFVANKRG